ILVFCQQNDLVSIVFPRFILTVFAHIKLTAHNWLNNRPFGFAASFFRQLVLLFNFFVVLQNPTHKLKSPHHIAMIRQSYGRHIMFGRCCHQITDGYGGLQNGELGVIVQVYESRILKGCETLMIHLNNRFTTITLANFIRLRFEVDVLQPDSLIGSGLAVLNSTKYPVSVCNSSGVNTSRRINSKKQRAVASTSAVALCASAKGTANKYSCNSVKVGSLYLPPRPPGSCNSSAVISVHVSNMGSCAIGLSTS